MKMMENVDFQGTPLTNATLEILTADPVGAAVGRIWFRSDTKQAKLKTDSSTVIVLSDGSTLNGQPASYYLNRANQTGTQTASTISDLATTVQDYTLDQFGSPVGTVNMNGQRLTGLGTPSVSSDAVTMSYVQALIQGWTWKEEARVIALTNINIASAPAIIDTETMDVNDRVLLNGQTLGQQNGLYIYNGSGSAMTLAPDANNATIMVAMVVPISSGTNPDTLWILATPYPFTLGTTPLTFTNLPMSGASAGNLGTGAQVYSGSTGSTLNFRSLVAGSTLISVTQETNDIKLDINPGSIDISTLTGTATVAQGGTGSGTASGARSNLGATGKASGLIGDGTTQNITFTHNLGTMQVLAQVFIAATGEKVYPDIFLVDSNNISIRYFQGLQPTLNAHEVVAIG
jgi:hypothetical protein